jgi:biotin carboxylase
MHPIYRFGAPVEKYGQAIAANAREVAAALGEPLAVRMPAGAGGIGLTVALVLGALVAAWRVARMAF